ncbi:hypothetical protein CC80DRAFT_535350 [Byssothecium circinans]|uniref:F-box domain-containing protein n=1 Tax=Byssothecium circinans TaxID=147558 RepID=A0A6A5TUX2_9PLEO|nr:hypothetical protein CC80DRAFT_535350 [Byssothecium circinans]
MAASLPGLPTELLLKIVELVGRKRLKALRLTCKRLEAVASGRLFGKIKTTFPNHSGAVQRFEGLLKSNIAGLVTTLDLQPYTTHFLYRTRHIERWFKDDCHELAQTLDLAVQLPNLRDIILNGTPGGMKDWELEYVSCIIVAILQLLCSSLCRRIGPPIHCLKLRPLPCKWNPKITSSVQFLVTMKKVERLHLHFDWFEEEYSRLRSGGSIPTHDYPKHEETHRFAERVPRSWLSHNISGLTHLSLSFHYGVGVYPTIDLRHVHFPNLSSLRLSGFNMAHPWQLNWIISHANLSELFLVGNTIVVSKISAHLFDDDGFPIYGTKASTQSRLAAVYQQRWYHWYHAIETKLPKLRYFMTQRKDITFREDINDNSVWGRCFGLPESRYMTYEYGFIYYRLDIRHLGEVLQGYDAGALASLVRKTGQIKSVEDLIRRHGEKSGFWETFGTSEIAGVIPQEHTHVSPNMPPPPILKAPRFRRVYVPKRRRRIRRSSDATESDFSVSGSSFHVLNESEPEDA